MSVQSQLRKLAMERDDGMCQWPGCGLTSGLQMAHLIHRGMGGSPSANKLSNVTMLCVHHHDILDGRSIKGRRHAVQALLGYYLRTKE